MSKESDPSGKDAHEAGAKLDHGKVRAALVLGDFAGALMEVAKVGTFGANKYSAHGWLEVEDGQARYDDAKMRHWLRHHMGEELDPDSDLDHLAHEAWNALAVLQFALNRRNENENGVNPESEKGHWQG